jgi:SsrA-binding protein
VIVTGDSRQVGAHARGGVRIYGGCWVLDRGSVHGLAVLETGDVRYDRGVEPGARLRRHEHDGEEQTLGAARSTVRVPGHWKVVRPDGGSVKLAARYIPNPRFCMAKPAPAVEVKVLARNKRARHEYHVDETLEAGLVLAGSEVKSIRAGKVTLVDAFADIDKGEAWLHQMDIGVYAFSHGRNHDPRRKRKLLLHRREIDRLVGKIREKSYTLVPLSLYEKKGRVKAEIALVHGKQSWDKREDVKKRESQREIDRAMASRRR